MEIDYVLVRNALKFMHELYLISGHVDHEGHIILHY
jgi:hypothetical protein